jgi:hypothetical protein
MIVLEILIALIGCGFVIVFSMIAFFIGYLLFMLPFCLLDILIDKFKTTKL